jgi:predicted GIY-YIG superfamily endonuclease
VPYNIEGRLAGCYVYMLLCQEAEGPIFVKIGMTDNPIARFRQLRNGCPHTPRQFAYFETYSRKEASRIERSLHKAYAKWHAHHEWFSFREDDKPSFNNVWKYVLFVSSTNGRKFEWTKISTAELIRLTDHNAKRARAGFARNASRGGLAFRQFAKDSRQ